MFKKNLSPFRYSSIWVLLSICLLQWILFAPLYFSRTNEGSFFPRLIPFPDTLVSRNNPDFFRWSLDYAILLFLFFFANRLKSIKIWTYVISALYLFLLIFQSYYYIVWKIYGEIPVWSYDWSLLNRVLPVFIKTMGINLTIFWGTILILCSVLFYGIFQIHLWMSHHCQWTFKQLLVSLLFFFILPLVISLTHPAPGDSNDSKSGILWITHNIEVALTKSRVKHLPNLEGPIGYETYKQLPLQSKPNIYLIFLEAYGTVVGSVSPYDLPYRNQLKNFESNLQSKGWYSVSTLSNSTILGGRSWLGFTTFISGLHIDNHPEYEKLIHEHVGFPHLINTLNDQGYTTYRLNTMSNEGSSFRALDSVAGRFFNVSSWTKYSDIPYKGYQYDYFGGIPDQYALWYWHDHVLQKKAEPYFLFFITLSTHAPFYLPPPIRTDWKSLDTIRTSPHNTVRSEDPKPLDRYSQSVAYILKVWENYILQAADSNDLFILVGDHQPAGMEFLIKGKTDTYATPMHIITKDPEWVTLLKDKGFTSGMLPEFKPGSLMHHEGFYSLWLNIWAQKDSIQNHPPYLPVGIE